MAKNTWATKTTINQKEKGCVCAVILLNTMNTHTIKKQARNTSGGGGGCGGLNLVLCQSTHEACPLISYRI